MPAAYLLEQLADFSGIPNRLRLLHLAQSLGAPVAPTLYIPPAALFEAFLRQPKVVRLLHERADLGDDPTAILVAEAKILQMFQESPLDPAFAKSIVAEYHQSLSGSFVRLFSTRGASNTENILGDSNLLESISQAAYTLLELALAANRSSTSSILEIASGICIQTQLQATSSGTVYSKHPQNAEKKSYAVSARLGVQPPQSGQEELDWYEVHKSTLQEIAAEIGTKTTSYKRTQDTVQKTAVPSKQQQKRILKPEQTEFLATLTAKISTKEFLPLTIQWETHKNTIHITEVTELEQPRTTKQTTNNTTQVIHPEHNAWVRLDVSWKNRSDLVLTLVQELSDSHRLEPSTNIIIPQLTSSHELTAIREQLLKTELSHQSRNYWPEITSVGMLHTLKESSALDFFAGIILDTPALLRSLFVTPSWTETELELLFSLIEEHVPTHLTRGIVLHEVTPNIVEHLSDQVYKHVHTTTDQVEKMEAVLSDLEVERWNAIP